MVKLIPGDVGRPLTDLQQNIHYPNLVADAEEVLHSLVLREFETQSQDGRWHQVRIRPYRTSENVIDGVVITFVDIHAQKQAEEKLQQTIDIDKAHHAQQQ